MSYYFNIEHPNAISGKPWTYKAWCCKDYKDSDVLHIFIFKEPERYDEVLRVVADYFDCVQLIFPVHGNWIWFFDTVHTLYKGCEVHFEVGTKAEENRLIRYLDGPQSVDCNVVHSCGGFIDEIGKNLYQQY